MTQAHNTDPNQEPRINDLLDDPIAQLLMQMDGVERTALDPLLHSIMDKISSASSATAPSKSAEVA